MSDNKQPAADTANPKVKHNSEKQQDQEQPVMETEEQDTGTTEDRAETEEQLTEEERLTKRVAELEDKLLRTAAEFDNYKKRIARNYDDLMQQANDNIIRELLEVVDNFERALQHNKEDSDNKAFRQGVELIFSQIKALLEKYNVAPIEAVGKTFDPNLHEALMQIESEEHPEGVIAVEVNRGYKQGDRVIRHAKVGVSKGKPKHNAKKSDK